MFYEHAVEAASIANAEQDERVTVNLKGLKRRLLGELLRHPDGLGMDGLAKCHTSDEAVARGCWL